MAALLLQVPPSPIVLKTFAIIVALVVVQNPGFVCLASCDDTRGVTLECHQQAGDCSLDSTEHCAGVTAVIDTADLAAGPSPAPVFHAAPAGPAVMTATVAHRSSIALRRITPPQNSHQVPLRI